MERLERYTYPDGRTIEIITNIDSRRYGLLKSAIEKTKRKIYIFCKKNRESQIFKELTILLIEKIPESGFSSSTKAAGAIYTKDVEEGLNRIYISLNRMLEFIRSGQSSNIGITFAHELSHLWHFKKSKIYQIAKRWDSRLRDVLGKISSRTPLKHYELKEINLTVREYLSLFIQLLFIEGVATYCSYSLKDRVVFSRGGFKKDYKNSKKRIKAMLKQYFRLQKNIKRQTTSFDLRKTGKILEKFKEHSTKNVYFIGYHMAYTIFYNDPKFTLEKLIRLSFYNFIKKYEMCILAEGKKPIVSLNSGKGYFDYNGILQDWWKYWKETKDKFGWRGKPR